MKNRIPDLIFILLALIGAILTFMLYSDNKELENQISDRDKLINNGKYKDSLYAVQTKRYSDTIIKYMSESSFEIDGKSISTAELLRILNNTFKENAKLRDSIFYCQLDVGKYKSMADLYKKSQDEIVALEKKCEDSLRVYRTMVNLINDRYGIQYQVEHKDGKTAIYKSGFSKADSGLLLLPYYGKYLKKSDGGGWDITIKN